MSSSYDPWANDGEAEGSTYIPTSAPTVEVADDSDSDHETVPLDPIVVNQIKLFEPLLAYFVRNGESSSDFGEVSTYYGSAQLIETIIDRLKKKKADVSAVDVITQVCKEEEV